MVPTPFRLNFTPSLPTPLPPPLNKQCRQGWEMGVVISRKQLLSAAPSSSHISPAPVWVLSQAPVWKFALSMVFPQAAGTFLLLHLQHCLLLSPLCCRAVSHAFSPYPCLFSILSFHFTEVPPALLMDSVVASVASL